VAHLAQHVHVEVAHDDLVVVSEAASPTIWPRGSTK
jgi:hypothetical protein